MVAVWSWLWRDNGAERQRWWSVRESRLQSWERCPVVRCSAVRWGGASRVDSVCLFLDVHSVLVACRNHSCGTVFFPFPPLLVLHVEPYDLCCSHNMMSKMEIIVLKKFCLKCLSTSPAMDWIVLVVIKCYILDCY